LEKTIWTPLEEEHQHGGDNTRENQSPQQNVTTERAGNMETNKTEKLET